jgi:hypothetical protein
VKLTLENLGRIRTADLEIKPLTVFIGKNNTKTWSAYALYGILRSLTIFQRSGFTPSIQLAPSCSPLDAAIEEVAQRAALRLAEEVANAPQSGTAQQLVTLDVKREEILQAADFGGTPCRFTLSEDKLATVLAVDPSVVAASRVYVTPPEGFSSFGKLASLSIAIDRQASNLSIRATGTDRRAWQALIAASLSEDLTIE